MFSIDTKDVAAQVLDTVLVELRATERELNSYAREHIEERHMAEDFNSHAFEILKYRSQKNRPLSVFEIGWDEIIPLIKEAVKRHYEGLCNWLMTNPNKPAIFKLNVGKVIGQSTFRPNADWIEKDHVFPKIPCSVLKVALTQHKGVVTVSSAYPDRNDEEQDLFNALRAQDKERR